MSATAYRLPQALLCLEMAWESRVAGLAPDVVLGADLLYDPGALQGQPHQAGLQALRA